MQFDPFGIRSFYQKRRIGCRCNEVTLIFHRIRFYSQDAVILLNDVSSLMEKIGRQFECFLIGKSVALTVFRRPENKNGCSQPRCKPCNKFQPIEKRGMCGWIENLKFRMPVKDRLKGRNAESVIRQKSPVIQCVFFLNGTQVGPDFRWRDLHTVYSEAGKQLQNGFIIMFVPRYIGDCEYIFRHDDTP